MVGPTEILDVDEISPLSKYPALPSHMFPPGTTLVTERQPAVRADKLSCDGAEAGQAQWGSVVVRTKRHGLLSKYEFPRLDISGGDD